MAKRVLLLLAILGSILFWSAFIAEISLRYVNGSSSFEFSAASLDTDEKEETDATGSRDGFLVLFVLVTLAVSSTSYLTYQITKRNQLTQQHASQSTSRRRNQRQTQGNKSSFKTSQSKTNRVAKSKSTATSGSTQRANKSGTTVDRTESSKADVATGERVKGRVRVYYTRRSYGFVEDENKHTIFFHKSAIDADIDERDLTKKPNVSYLVTPSDRGPVATDIRLEQ